jgi:multiple antibiotic resistance protein
MSTELNPQLTEQVGHFLSVFGVIFAVIDPFGYVPIFLSMTAKTTEQHRRFMLKKASIVAFLALVMFTFVGRWILAFFGISMAALQIAGGLVLLLIGLDMLQLLRGSSHGPMPPNMTKAEDVHHPLIRQQPDPHSDMSIVPFAIPMLCGPASITSVLVLSSRDRSFGGFAIIIGCVFLTLGFTYLVLLSGNRILKAVGLSGVQAVTRIMGLVLCAMAVQFVINGYLQIPTH